MTEDDWPLLYAWNNDPEVLYYSEGGDVTSRSLEDVQRIYRTISQAAFCFVMEVDGRPIGECWLQEMNLQSISNQFPGRDLRRIDLAIADAALWGHGYGTRA